VTANVATRDAAVTAIVSALRAVDRSDPSAMRRCVDALGLALDPILESDTEVQPSRSTRASQ
jgi:hypothetical protein